MKIGLINTGLDETAPPLNLAYLAASLKLNGFDNLKIIDPTFCPGSLPKASKGFDFLGISAITKYYKKACAIARKIRGSSGVPVIIGGFHISTMPDSLSPDFDLGVIGEGEKTAVELCKILNRDGCFGHDKLNETAGIAFWQGGQIIKTAPAPQVENLDAIPMPDFGLLDERYFRKKWINWTQRAGRLMHITTARGCPYNCIFCAAKRYWQTVRWHSARRVFAEVQMLAAQWGIDHIVIDDDLFLSNKNRLEEFADLMQQSSLSGKIAFSCNARTSLLDEDMCRILKRIGVKLLNFGFESGSDKILRFLKGEDITVAGHKRAIYLCNEYGFKVYGSLIFASPAETLDDMHQTLQFIDFAIKNGCHKLWAFVATPLPQTPFWEIAKQRGKVSGKMDWDLLDLNSCDNPLLLEPEINLNEFKKIFKEATARLDRAWMKDKWLRTMIFEHRKALRRLLENPIRAFSMFRNIFFKKD